MSSQDKIKRKSTEEKCFCVDISSRIDDHFVKWRQECLSLDEDLLLLRMHVFLHKSRITSYGRRFASFLTLKLSAVILALAGTAYMLLGDKGNDGDNSIVSKLITRWVCIARRLVAKISPHHALPNRFRLESPMVADIFDFLGSYIVGKFRMQSGSFTPFISSGEVQSELFTEENTCMTSSEDNRVSIPPKRSEIGLSDSRSCDSSQ